MITNKKNPKGLFLSISAMAGIVSHRWNQLYVSLIQTVKRLEELGLYTYEDQIRVIELPEEVWDGQPLHD